MSRSNYCGYPREKLVKFENKRTGWFGESCFAAEGRKFIKKLQHKYNRKAGKLQVKQELNYLE
jgi:hypothetical protein